ncbi:hypothetical protein GCM10009529_04100 [Micropruina glycogenica]
MRRCTDVMGGDGRFTHSVFLADCLTHTNTASTQRAHGGIHNLTKSTLCGRPNPNPEGLRDANCGQKAREWLCEPFCPLSRAPIPPAGLRGAKRHVNK